MIKTLLSILCIIAISNSAFAKPTEKSLKKTRSTAEYSPGNFSVRCGGKTKKGTSIGIDIELDSAERIISGATFEEDSVAPIEDLKYSANASRFIKRDKDGVIQIFGFKTFNEAIEEDISVSYVKGSKSLSNLMYHDGMKVLTADNISCKIIPSESK